jgi:hypothetical protein
MEKDVINVKEFLQTFLEIAPDTISVKNKNAQELIQSDMKLTDPILDRLKEVCE